MIMGDILTSAKSLKKKSLLLTTVAAPSPAIAIAAQNIQKYNYLINGFLTFLDKYNLQIGSKILYNVGIIK